MANTIRVGMVGVTPDRGFSSIAHMPALQALPEFEVVAVCTTRQATAEPRRSTMASPWPLPILRTRTASGHRPGDGLRESAGPFHPGHGCDRCRQACLFGMAARA